MDNGSGGEQTERERGIDCWSFGVTGLLSWLVGASFGLGLGV